MYYRSIDKSYPACRKVSGWQRIRLFLSAATLKPAQTRNDKTVPDDGLSDAMKYLFVGRSLYHKNSPLATEFLVF